MGALTLHAPVKQGRDWLLAVELSVGNDTFLVSASLSPETLSWAKRMVKRKSSRLLELFSWVKDAIGNRVNLRGDWGKFGALGKLARDVVKQVADGAVMVPSDETISAAKLYLLAEGGDPQAQKILRAYGQDPILMPVHIAAVVLKRPDWYVIASALCAQANAGDRGSRDVVEAIHAFKEPDSEDIRDTIGINYDLDQAIACPNGSSKRMARYINHYRLARLAPYQPNLDKYTSTLAQHTRLADPFIGSHRRGGYHRPQDLMIRTGMGRF